MPNGKFWKLRPLYPSCWLSYPSLPSSHWSMLTSRLSPSPLISSEKHPLAFPPILLLTFHRSQESPILSLSLLRMSNVKKISLSVCSDFQPQLPVPSPALLCPSPDAQAQPRPIQSESNLKFPDNSSRAPRMKTTCLRGRHTPN